MKALGIMCLVILSMIGALIGGMIGMFIGATTLPLKILNGNALKLKDSITDIINSDIDHI